MPPARHSARRSSDSTPPPPRSNSFMSTAWCTTTCRPWTTMTCAAAAPPVIAPSMKPPPSSPAMHCRRAPSKCWRRRPPTISANARIEMLRVLADAIGTRGMAGGQAIDLAAVKQALNEARARAHASAEDRRAHPGECAAGRHFGRLVRCCGACRARRVRRRDRPRLPDPGRHSRRRGKYRYSRQTRRRRRANA